MATSLVEPDLKFPVPEQYNIAPKLKYGYLLHTTRRFKVTNPSRQIPMNRKCNNL
jgi:hypothetical protein